MTLTERYLGAVRWNLPADKADDIIAELADLIAARVEDREEALGRALRSDEISALLKEFGHPLTVAGRYHGQRVLIGAELFPFYWFVLRLVLALVAGVAAIQVAGRLLLGSEPFTRALMHGFDDARVTLLVQAALVTIAFAVVERSGWLTTYLERWKPETLPDLSGLRLKGVRATRPRRHPAWNAFSSIIVGAAFLLWWFGVFTVPMATRGADITVTAGPVWTALFWPVTAVVVGRMLFGAVTLVRPDWKPLRAALILGCTAGSLAILAVLHHAGPIVLVSGTAEKVAAVQAGLDKGLGIALMSVAVGTVCQAAVELWQVYRGRC